MWKIPGSGGSKAMCKLTSRLIYTSYTVSLTLYLLPLNLPAETAEKKAHPAFLERVEERADMVKKQIQARGIKDEKVLAAMGHVPRHRFVLNKYENGAYDDHPLAIGYGQTISQPYIVGFMTEVLNLSPGDKVLEIGTGSGYQAAVLSEITDNVYSIEIVVPLALKVKNTFKALGYTKISAKQGDGYYGWEEHAPFDAIIVTAASGHIPPPLISQLKPGGRMCIPVGEQHRTQYLILVEKDKNRIVTTRNLMAVMFVPLTGGH